MIKVPPIFAVSFDDQPWSRDRLNKHVAERGLSVFHVHGVNGANLGLKSMNPFDQDEHGKETYIHHTQIGRVISHRIALGVALSYGSSEFIVVEADAWFTDDFQTKWSEFRMALDPNAELAQLQYLDKNLEFNKLTDFTGRTIPYPFCTVAIWWTSSTAKKAISQLWAFDRPYDIMLIQRVYPYVNHYVANPQLVLPWSERPS